MPSNWAHTSSLKPPQALLGGVYSDAPVCVSACVCFNKISLLTNISIYYMIAFPLPMDEVVQTEKNRPGARVGVRGHMVRNIHVLKIFECL